MRGFWTETDRVLSPLVVDRKVVESVIHRQVDQYILGGQDLSVKIPAVLHERMERLSHQVRTIGRKGKENFFNMLEKVCI